MSRVLMYPMRVVDAVEDSYIWNWVTEDLPSLYHVQYSTRCSV